jgi:hypothetical protein
MILSTEIGVNKNYMFQVVYIGLIINFAIGNNQNKFFIFLMKILQLDLITNNQKHILRPNNTDYLEKFISQNKSL